MNDSLEEGKTPEPLKVKQRQFSNDPKLTNRIKIGQPIFKREVRNFISRAGYHELLEKLNMSDYQIRQIKNGQTIFEQEVMRTKYANPFFKNPEMHHKMLELLDQSKPKLVPNPNINSFEEDLLPIPDKTNRSQAPWLKHSVRAASIQPPHLDDSFLADSVNNDFVY